MDDQRDETLRSVSRPFLLVLVLGFAAVSVPGLAFVLLQQRHLESGRRLSDSLVRTIALNQQIRRGLDQQVSLLQRYVQDRDPSLQERFLELSFQLGDDETRYLKLEIGQDERLAVESIKSLQGEMGLAAVRVFELLKVDDRAGAQRAMRTVEETRPRIDQEFEKLNTLQARALQQALAPPGEARLLTAVLLVLLALLLAVLTGFVLLLRRRVLRPLERMLAATDAVQRGDLRARAEAGARDELGQLARRFNFMAESLGASYANLEQKVAERTRELERVQDQLIQSEKMSAVGQLVSGVAHELNNPLTAVMGFAELAQNSLSAGNPEAPEIHKLEVIRQQADRCRRIVASLLQFARQQETSLEPVRLNEVVGDAVRLREYELGTHGIDLHCEADPADPVVLADAFKMQQVVLVLINNAVDAIREVRESGNVTVETRSADGYAVLRVTDDGRGVAELDRVFDPFYTTKPVGKGTGLGLSVCYGIVREHGGEIVAANREVGAEFTVRLPLAGRPAPGAASTRAEGRSPGGLRGTALVVDDEQPLVDLQVSMLRQLGITATGVSDGESAIRYLERHDVGLVISDIRMPGAVDGLRLFEWVRNHRPELASRFLLTSGDVVDLDRVSRGRLPVFCLRKPFSFDEYSDVVCETLEERCQDA